MFARFFAVAFVAIGALATPGAAQGVVVGGKGGINLATWGGADVNDFETGTGLSITTRTGVAAGGFLSFPLGGPIRLQPELLYVSKGTKVEGGGESGTFQVGYLEVPVLLVFKPEVAGTLRPSLFAGGAFAFKLSCSLKSSGVSVNCKDTGVVDVKGADYGLVFGGGLGFAMGSGEITIDGRYNLGLSKFIDVNPSAAISNRGFTIMAGYAFKVGH